MNKIILLGRLVKDPEVRVTPTDRTVCTFTLAVDRPFSGKDGKREADFINIQTWNKTAELIGNYVSKGQRLLVDGRLQIRSYDGKDGQKHYATEVVADRVEFIERKEKTGQTANTAPKQGFESMGQDVTQTFNEEIPF